MVEDTTVEREVEITELFKEEVVPDHKLDSWEHYFKIESISDNEVAIEPRNFNAAWTSADFNLIRDSPWQVTYAHNGGYGPRMVIERSQ